MSVIEQIAKIMFPYAWDEINTSVSKELVQNDSLIRAKLVLQGLSANIDEGGLEEAALRVYNNGVEFAGHGPNKYRSSRYAKIAVKTYLNTISKE